MTNSDCLAILCRQINHDAEFVELPAKSLGLWQGWESVSHLHLSFFHFLLLHLFYLYLSLSCITLSFLLIYSITLELSVSLSQSVPHLFFFIHPAAPPAYVGTYGLLFWFCMFSFLWMSFAPCAKPGVSAVCRMLTL